MLNTIRLHNPQLVLVGTSSGETQTLLQLAGPYTSQAPGGSKLRGAEQEAATRNSPGTALSVRAPQHCQ